MWESRYSFVEELGEFGLDEDDIGSCKGNMRKSELGMFSMETIKRGRNERMKVKARMGLTTPLGGGA